MRRPNKRSSSKLSSDSQRLIMLAQAIMQASSRLEERAWERELDALLERLLKSRHQETIDAALEHAFKVQSAAYDVLMESVEAISESCALSHEGIDYDALLIAVPILAWTRFAIASGPIPTEMAITLSAHLHAHVLATDVRASMMPNLYSIDQLPRTHAETFALTHELARAAVEGRPNAASANAIETAPFLADTRYLLACAVTKAAGPIYRWQTDLSVIGREQVLAQWQAQAKPNIERLLPGCGLELLLPEAYFVACREGDRLIRPPSLQAAVNYLNHALGVEPSGLQAIVGGFGEDAFDGRIDEYRISFSLRQEPDVFYGVVWPLYGHEDAEQSDNAVSAINSMAGLLEADEQTPLDEIVGLLKKTGIAHIKLHPGCFPMEACEDCGAPLYLDVEGELVHAEMPDDTPQGGSHLH